MDSTTTGINKPDKLDCVRLIVPRKPPARLGVQ
ncbi:hypothetical protein L326_0122475 [Yersinia pestis 113]|nr:hypothetical protein L326_0122475 [Yersinia pestis 113]